MDTVLKYAGMATALILLLLGSFLRLPATRALDQTWYTNSARGDVLLVPSLSFTGSVYNGSPPTTSFPIQFVKVTLYGSDQDDELGASLAEDTTSDSGHFQLQTDDTSWTYYHIVETDRPGYVSVASEAGPGGVSVDANWIRHENVGSGSHLDNNFWDRRPTSTPTATTIISTQTPTVTSTATETTATQTPTETLTVTPSVTPSATSIADPTQTPTSTGTPTATTTTPSTTPTPTPTATQPVLVTPTYTPTIPLEPIYMPLIMIRV